MVRNRLSSTLLVFALLIAGVLPAAAQTSVPAKPKAPGAQAPAKEAGPSAEGQDLAAADLRAIRKPPLPEFHPQQPKRIQLSNGMVIFLQEDHELTLIDGTAHVRGGSKSEPEDKVGLVSIYGDAWRTARDRTGGRKIFRVELLDRPGR